MNKLLVVGVILLFFGSSIPILAQSDKSNLIPLSDGKTLYVGGSGPGNYSTIQAAIDNASDGETIFVFQGTYHENVVIDKTLNLIGENRDTTIIIGKMDRYVLTVNANKINMTGFTIQNSHNIWNYSGIGLLSSGNTISNNTVNGIDILGGDYNNIVGNTILNNWYGVFLKDASHNYIAENTISKMQGGIWGRGYCRNDTILRNNISHNACNINLWEEPRDWVISNNHLSTRSGIYIVRCKNITVTGNEIFNTDSVGMEVSGSHIRIDGNFIHNGVGDGGLVIWGCSYSTVINNIFENDSSGIYSENVSFVNITCNKIRNCSYGIVIRSSGKSNVIFNNEFRNNHVGLDTEMVKGTEKITCNNFIDNSRPITFVQVLPIRRQTIKNPVFDKNYYDDWIRVGPKVLWGRTVIFAIPFWYYSILIYIPGVYCDWHPAKKPYDIPTMN